MSKTIRVHGDFKKTITYLNRAARPFFIDVLKRYGQIGVDALKANTPKKTGKTAESWSYRIEASDTGATIYWENSNVVDYVNIALILQYGHGTRNGGYVEGIDYINPALKPVFEKLGSELLEEVSS